MNIQAYNDMLTQIKAIEHCITQNPTQSDYTEIDQQVDSWLTPRTPASRFKYVHIPLSLRKDQVRDMRLNQADIFNQFLLDNDWDDWIPQSVVYFELFLPWYRTSWEKDEDILFPVTLFWQNMKRLEKEQRIERRRSEIGLMIKIV